MKTTLKLFLPNDTSQEQSWEGLPPLGDEASFLLAAAWATPILQHNWTDDTVVGLEYIFENDGDLPVRLACQMRVDVLREDAEDPVEVNGMTQRGGPYDGWSRTHGDWLIEPEPIVFAVEGGTLEFRS